MNRSNDAVTLSGDEYDELMRDKERLDQLAHEAKGSRTGVTIQYLPDEKGFRAMRFHKIFGVKPTLREAIDEAFFK